MDEEFEAVKIDERLANATQNMIEGRPDIFNRVCTGTLRETLRYALDYNSTGVRLVGERSFIARGWNEIVAVWNAKAADAETATAAVNAWYATVDAGENW